MTLFVRSPPALCTQHPYQKPHNHSVCPLKLPARLCLQTHAKLCRFRVKMALYCLRCSGGGQKLRHCWQLPPVRLPRGTQCHCTLSQWKKIGEVRHFPCLWHALSPSSCLAANTTLQYEPRIFTGVLDLSVILSQQMWSLLHRAVKPWSLSLFTLSEVLLFGLVFNLVHDTHCKMHIVQISWTDVYIHYICL